MQEVSDTLTILGKVCLSLSFLGTSNPNFPIKQSTVGEINKIPQNVIKIFHCYAKFSFNLFPTQNTIDITEIATCRYQEWYFTVTLKNKDK